MEKFTSRIKSYVLRTGRTTRAQEKAIEDLWPEYGIEYDKTQRLDFTKLFANSNDTVLEIGFGMGDSLFEMALNNPKTNFLGIEVHKSGVGGLLNKIKESELSNLKIICHDAVEVLENMILDASLSKVQIFFPDPWHKKRHNKRRIVRKDFIDLVSLKLKQDAILHLATDWQDYAEHMLEVIEAEPKLINLFGVNNYADNVDRPRTKFEARGIRLGHSIFDLQYKKK